MKKRICSIMLVLALVVAVVIVPQVPIATYASEQPISVTINGERVIFADQNPVIVDSRTLVPVRGVFENLGFDVGWASDTRQAILTSDTHTVVITVGSATFTVNGVNRTLDVPAQIIGDRTMLPIRAVVESVGYFVDWDAATRTVLITGSERWDLALFNKHSFDIPHSILMAEAAQEIYNRTNGVVNIEHFHTDVIVDWLEVWNDVVQGSTEIAIVVPPLSVDSRFAMLYIPYLVTCYEEGKNLWTYGSNFFDILTEVAKDNEVALLGIVSGGLMGIGTNWPFEAAAVWNFDQPSQEAFIRLPPLRIMHIMAEIMQLRVTEIPLGDVHRAIATGVIDGWIGGGPEINYRLTRDVINYYYDFRYVDDLHVIVMNRNFYYSIPENYREVVFEVMQEASMLSIAKQAERSAHYLQRMRNIGITVFQPTDVQRRQMQEAMIRRGWSALAEEFGQDVMDRILSDIR